MIYLDCYTDSPQIFEFDIDSIGKSNSAELLHLCDLLALVLERHPMLVQTALTFIHNAHVYGADVTEYNESAAYEIWERHFTPREARVLTDLYHKICELKHTQFNEALTGPSAIFGYVNRGALTVYNNNVNFSIIILLSQKEVL